MFNVRIIVDFLTKKFFFDKKTNAEHAVIFVLLRNLTKKLHMAVPSVSEILLKGGHFCFRGEFL